MSTSVVPPFFNLLVALPQDPYNLYVYWSFAPERLKVLQDFWQKLGGKPRMVLRLRPNPAAPPVEVEVPLEEAGSAYFRFQEPLAVFTVEIGFVSPEGKFFSLGCTPVGSFALTAEYSPPPKPTHHMPTPEYFPLELYRWS